MGADPSSTAAAAILVTKDRAVLLQHRDANPEIWFPEHWGLFGGAIDPGESPEEALVRELMEEIGYPPPAIRYVTQVAFDLGPWNLGVKLRYVFEVPIDRHEVAGLTLNEGQGMKLFDRIEALSEPQMTPYDRLALGLYFSDLDPAPRHEV